MKKENRKTNPKDDVISEIREEFKRHTTALMEHMTKEVKTVAEGHGIIIKKLEEHDKKFTKIESELDTISMAVMDTSQTAKSIEKKLDNHEARIVKLEEKVHA